jgi:NAD-dependent SIR2 family protein deacetylase
VAGLPHETLGAGGQVAVVNLGPTLFDEQVALRIEAPAAEVLPAVARVLNQ